MSNSEKIKLILKTKRWTQVRLAKYLKIDPPRLNNWYHDRNSPGPEWMQENLDNLYNECVKQNNKEEV